MKKIKIAVIGAKGIPAKYGGYETFAEKISMIFKESHEVLVVGDGTNEHMEPLYEGIHILNSNYFKSINPIKFYHDSLKMAESWGADMAIMCGIGGVFSLPFFSRSKMKIYVNPDGLGFKRKKWVWWKKIALYVQFLFAAYFVKYLVCDSEGIKIFFKEKFNRINNVFVAEYGAELNENIDYTSKVEKYFNDLDILKDKYYLVVSRLEPENNVKIIINGYLKSNRTYPLIIVGNTNTTHGKKLLSLKSANVRFINGVYNQHKLSALRRYSTAYFHGHSVGGTNPSLLEAMGSGNLTIAHDNVFNREVLNDSAYFFENVNDIKMILEVIENGIEEHIISKFKKDSQFRIKSYYAWENIANKYLLMFESTKNA